MHLYSEVLANGIDVVLQYKPKYIYENKIFSLELK